MANSAEFDRLVAEVAEDKSVKESAATLLSQLSELIRSAANDPAAVTALADQLDSQSAALSAAIVANTPAATEVPPVEEPPVEPPFPSFSR